MFWDSSPLEKNLTCVLVSIFFYFSKSNTNIYKTYKTNIALQHSLFFYEQNSKLLNEIART